MSDLDEAREAAQEWLGCKREIDAQGHPYCTEHHYGWLRDVGMCPTQERVAALIAGRDAQIERAARADEREQVMQRAELDWLNATRGASERADGYTWETAPSRPRYITRALTRVERP